MALEISAITDLRLQKFATKVDDGNGVLNQNEISDLFVNMAKKKYNYTDFKALLGLEFEQMENTEKKQLLNTCLEKLDNSMLFAERMQQRQKEKLTENQKKDKNTLIGASAAIGTMLGANALMLGGATVKQVLIRIVGGAALGSLAGLALATIATICDKQISKEQQARLATKDDYKVQILKEIEDLDN